MGRSKNIFKDIEDCLIDTRYAIKLCNKKDKEQYKRLDLQLQALTKVKDYVDSYNWMSKSKSIEHIKYIRAAKFDYKLCREHLKWDDRKMKNFIHYCVKRLKSRIGANTIDLIMEGKVGTAMLQFEADGVRYFV